MTNHNLMSLFSQFFHLSFSERDLSASLTTQLTATKDELTETNISLGHLSRREEELLAINQELTECTARLQNELAQHKARAMALAVENENASKERRTFDTRYGDLEEQLRVERSSRAEERDRLEVSLVNSERLVHSLEEQLSTALGDIEAMRHKHQQSLKELNRELMLSQRKCHKLEQGRGTDSDCHSMKSDNASDSESHSGTSRKTSSVSTCDNGLPGVSILEPSKQSLIDRIVRLQQANAKQTEKLDFLESHSATLVTELQKKAKLVHYYMMRDQSGALVSAKSDKHKAELAKYGGIMSAIYSGVKGTATSADMTLDLSLEINKKLQAVLEDTLLKNITLKVSERRMGIEIQ